MLGTKQAARRELSTDDGCILPYIAAFHRLRSKSEEGKGLTMEEGQMLARLLSMFESCRVLDGRLVRTPLKLALDRPAWLTVGGSVWRGTAREASLRHFVVCFEQAPAVGATGELSVSEAGGGDGWWRFAGRVTRVDPRSGRAVVELGVPLGREELEWHAA